MEENQTDYFAPVYFPDGDPSQAKFIYDYDMLTVRQVENAKEIGEFKFLQLQKEARDYRELIQSRAGEWLIIAMSYLLCPVVNGVPTKWNPAQVGEIELFLNDLSHKEVKRLEACVNHFFIAVGKREAISLILRGKGSSLYKATLLEKMLGNALRSTSENKLLTDVSKSKARTIKMK